MDQSLPAVTLNFTPCRRWRAADRDGPESLRPGVVQAECQGQLLPQLERYSSELLWADGGVQLAGTGGARVLSA